MLPFSAIAIAQPTTMVISSNNISKYRTIKCVLFKSSSNKTMTQFFGLCVAIVTAWEANAFFNVVPFNRYVPLQTSTAQFMGRKVKPPMSERRKRRAKRTSSDSALDTFPTFEKNGASQPTSPPQEVSAVSEKATCVEADETIEKASSLVELQRKVCVTLRSIMAFHM